MKNIRYSIEDFVSETGERDLGQGVFELERDRLLEVNLNGMVWSKRGSMVAYKGGLSLQEKESSSTGLANS